MSPDVWSLDPSIAFEVRIEDLTVGGGCIIALGAGELLLNAGPGVGGGFGVAHTAALGELLDVNL